MDDPKVYHRTDTKKPVITNGQSVEEESRELSYQCCCAFYVSGRMIFTQKHPSRSHEEVKQYWKDVFHRSNDKAKPKRQTLPDFLSMNEANPGPAL
jgi:hypothetical protein